MVVLPKLEQIKINGFIHIIQSRARRAANAQLVTPTYTDVHTHNRMSSTTHHCDSFLKNRSPAVQSKKVFECGATT